MSWTRHLAVLLVCGISKGLEFLGACQQVVTRNVGFEKGLVRLSANGSSAYWEGRTGFTAGLLFAEALAASAPNMTECLMVSTTTSVY